MRLKNSYIEKCTSPAAILDILGFDVSHAFSCPRRSFLSIRHDRLRGLFAEFLTEVCPNVSTEPALQPISGETFSHRSANTDDGARLDTECLATQTVKGRDSTSPSAHLVNLSSSCRLHSLLFDFGDGFCRKRAGSTIAAFRAIPSIADASLQASIRWNNSCTNNVPALPLGTSNKLLFHCTVSSFALLIASVKDSPSRFPHLKMVQLATSNSVSIGLRGGCPLAHCCRLLTAAATTTPAVITAAARRYCEDQTQLITQTRSPESSPIFH